VSYHFFLYKYQGVQETQDVGEPDQVIEILVTVVFSTPTFSQQPEYPDNFTH